MSTATLEIYNALIEAGVAKDSAEAAAKAVISKQEAKDMLVSKVDLYRALNIHTGVIVSVIGVLIAIFNTLA